jgi:Xaa-Pro dipeptidase
MSELDTLGWPLKAQTMLAFPVQTYRRRIESACAELRRRNLDGLLMFRQESMYYLTGYDTMGFITFQCMVLSASGDIALLTRAPDLRAARLTSIVEDIEILPDRADVHPADLAPKFLAARISATGRLGIEVEAPGLRVPMHQRLVAAIGEHRLTPADDLVAGLRLVKEPEEIALIRTAARLADDAMDEALALIAPGVSEAELLAAMQSKVMRGGGDYAASRWILGCGLHALLVRHFGSHDGIIAGPDQVQLEFGAAFRHYHACLFHTVYVGAASARARQLRTAAVEALDAAADACRPGAPVGAMFDAYAKTCSAHGLERLRLNACGYSLGATFPPTWMDGNLICEGAQTLLAAGMVFFPHMVLIDDDVGVTGCAGETLLVTESGCERLSQVDHKLYIV